jgi:hypothetical protein
LAWLASPGFGLRAPGLGFTLSKPKPKPAPTAWLGLALAQAVASMYFFPLQRMAENPQAHRKVNSRTCIQIAGNQIQPKLNIPSKVEVVHIWW